MFAIDKHLYKTESDVEQKLIYPLLTEILGYLPAELLTKHYLSPTDLDKGAGKKSGYYPDYLVYLGGQPILVVEAKDPETAVALGYREARLYAGEVNKLFPSGINPLTRVISTNGIQLWSARVGCDELVESHRLRSRSQSV